jgi:hypothetical protein
MAVTTASAAHTFLRDVLSPPVRGSPQVGVPDAQAHVR